MNPLHYFRFFSYQKKLFLLISKPLCSLSSQKLGLLNTLTRDELNINYNKKFYENDHLDPRTSVTNIHVNGYRYLRRRPIKVTYSDKNKETIMDDYIEEAKSQTSEIPADEVISSASEVVSSPKPASKIDKMQKSKDLTMNKLSAEEISVKMPSPESSPERTSQWPLDQDTEEDKMLQEKVLKNLSFKLLSRAPKEIKSFFSQVNSPWQRRVNDVFMVEGWRLLAEALNSGLKPHAILYSRSRLFLNMIPLVSENEKDLAHFLNLFHLYKTPYRTFKLWSSLTTPPGLVGFFSLAEAQHLCSTRQKCNFPLTVVLDNIGDPNNLGSIIRTLVGAGVAKIIMMQSCCDLWDSKVMRTASGAHFHLHCITGVGWTKLEFLLNDLSPTIFLADFCRDTAAINDDDYVEEGNDSNVEVRREKSYEELKSLGKKESLHMTFHMTDKNGDEIVTNASFNDPDHLSNFNEVQLPQLFYNEINFYSARFVGHQSPVLIIGGEMGLSNCAKKFAIENDGIQVSIPLQNRIESLNSTVATGILVYEMQKQLMALTKSREQEVDNSSSIVY